MNLRQRSGVLAVLLAALLGGGVAFAAWLATGTGPLTGRAGTIEEIIVTATTPVTDLLYPGAAGRLTGTLQNPNPFPVVVTTVSLGQITSGNPILCPASNVFVSSLPRLLVTPVVIPAQVGDTPGTAPLELPGAISMTVDAVDGCKNQSFEVTGTVTGVPAQPA